MNSLYDDMGLILGIVVTVILIWNTVDARSNDTIEDFWGSNQPYPFFKEKIKRSTGCSSKKMWGIIRHGAARYNEPERMVQIQANILNSTYSKLEEHKKQRLSEWKRRTWSLDGQLSASGRKEIEGIAERIKKSFPELFDIVNRKQFFFITAQIKIVAALASMNSFASAIFNGITPSEVTQSYREKNGVHTFLEQYVIERKTKKELFDIELLSSKQQLIQKSIEAQNDCDKMNNYLNINLDILDYGQIYTTYARDVAASTEKESVWKFAVTLNIAKLFDKVSDLELSNNFGGDFPENYAAACFIYQEIIEFFNGRNRPDKNIVFYFTDAQVAIAMLTFIGYFKDPPRASQFGGFANNIFFVFLECEKTLHVQLFHQELEVAIPNCNPCTWTAFQEMLLRIISDQGCVEIEDPDAERNELEEQAIIKEMQKMYAAWMMRGH